MRSTYRTIIFLLLSLQLLSFSVPEMQAAGGGGTYYVDGSHPQAKNATGHGSLDQPWKTLSYAFAQLRPGDTLLVRKGTYKNTEIILTAKNSGQAQAPITVQAYPNETVILDNGDIFDFKGVQWWVIDGFVFQNFSRAMTIFQLGREGAIAKNIIIRNCTFRDSKVAPIRIAYAEDILIENNHITRINTMVPGVGASGIELLRLAKRITIRENRFIDNATDGIHIGATATPKISDITIEGNEFWLTTDQFEWGENGVAIKTVQGPITIRNNYFHGFRPTYKDSTGHKGGSLGEALIILMGAQNIQVESNVFEDNSVHVTISDHTHEGYPSTKNITVVNNIFKNARYYKGNKYRPSGYGIAVKVNRATQNINILHNTLMDNNYYISSKQMNAVFQNNVINSGKVILGSSSNWVANFNAWSNINGSLPNTLKGKDDIYPDDLMVDSAFRPLTASPLFDMGNNVGVPNDFDGNPRNDGQPDLGAFEGGETVIAGTFLSAEPTQSELHPGDVVQVKVSITAAAELYGLQVVCRVDPAVLAWQEAQFEDFFSAPLIGAKNMDVEAGIWMGADSQKNPAPALSGNGRFVTMTFEALAPGTSSIDCEPLASDRDGFELPITSVGNMITVSGVVPESPRAIAGVVEYQGRSSHDNIWITAVSQVERSTQTTSDGHFEIDNLEGSDFVVRADADLYLPSCTTASAETGQMTDLPLALLVGGDTDDDDVIKINDATLIGSNFGLSSSTIPAMNVKADINGDGQVNIQDLAILGGNFGKQGCQLWSNSLAQAEVSESSTVN